MIIRCNETSAHGQMLVTRIKRAIRKFGRMKQGSIMARFWNVRGRQRQAERERAQKGSV